MRLTVGPLGASLVLLATWSPSALAAEWQVDPARSTIAAVVRQGASGGFEARFERFAAEVAFDPARPEATRVTVTVDTASFASGHGQRDQVATGDAFLAAKSHREARYVTRAVRPLGGDRYEVEADLELRGVIKPLTHAATIAAGPGEARATGEVEIARADWGVGRDQPRGADVGAVVVVRFDLAATRRSGG
jgi:polyisoprenoid-binding protein YceI